jgi:hypothetical protein
MQHLNGGLSPPESAMLVQNPMTKSLDEIPDELWQVGCTREAVIRPLTAVPAVGRGGSSGFGSPAGLRLQFLAAYRCRPQTSTLVPKHRVRPHDTRILDAKVEGVIEAAITGFHLTRKRPRFSDLSLRFSRI